MKRADTWVVERRIVIKQIKFEVAKTPKKWRYCPNFDDNVNMIITKVCLDHGSGENINHAVNKL